eukprot:scaffold684_cov345-Pavlova_lutheri.AAC.80
MDEAKGGVSASHPVPWRDPHPTGAGREGNGPPVQIHPTLLVVHWGVGGWGGRNALRRGGAPGPEPNRKEGGARKGMRGRDRGRGRG